MKKKLWFLVIAVILAAAVLMPSLAWGADGSADLSVSAEIDFPASLTFSISAQSGSRINDIRLHYTIDKQKLVDIVSEEIVVFSPSKDVSVRHILDMRQTGGLPPGSSLTYWVTVTDDSGKVTESLPQKVAVNDTRYNWKSLQEGKVTLYWYQGDNDFAAELMDAAQDALGKTAENSGAELETAISLYIYANTSDLLGALIFPQEWTGGVAFTEFGIIAIGISNAQLAWGKRTIAHEITHLVVHQVTLNPYNGIPPWLDEGLAMNSEGTLDAQFTNVLDTAEDSGSFITVQSLSSPFSAYMNEAVLAYAESYMIVRYLIDTYGRDKMLALLTAFQSGSGYNEALETVYGFDMSSLNSQWQAAGIAP